MATEDIHGRLEQMAIHIWPGVVDAIDALVARSEHEGEWSTRPGTALAGDDAKSAPYQTSHAVQMLLNAGIDNLNGVRHLIFGRPEGAQAQPVLHQAAHFLLARGAIENLATALWILGPRQRSARVERTLLWHVKNAKDQHSATERFGPGPRTLEDRLLDLERRVLAATGAVPAKFRNGYFGSTAVRYADEYDGTTDSQLSHFFVWQLCSGFAHGCPWASLGFLEAEIVETHASDVLSARLTSDMHRALLAPKQALHICEQLLRRHTVLNTPTFG